MRVQYSSADPAAGPSDWSDVNNFKTCWCKQGGAEGNFSTTIYTGSNGGSQTISTGIDNTSKSLVWIKGRGTTPNHCLCDTARGPNKYLSSNTTQHSADNPQVVQSFNSDGVTLGFDGMVNGADDYVAWNFAAAAGFFDVVTYDVAI